MILEDYFYSLSQQRSSRLLISLREVSVMDEVSSILSRIYNLRSEE